MNTRKHSPCSLLILALLAFTAPLAALAQDNLGQTRPPVRANPLETPENTPQSALTNAHAKAEVQSDTRPTSPVQNKKVEDLSFDAFPAKAAKREINPRAVSPSVAAQLAARMPQYTPPPEPKPKAEDPDTNAEGELADLRETDQPQNKILRLPDYVVREKKPPVFRERDIHSPSGLAALAARHYLSETAQALNRYTIPFLGNGAQAYALARYEEDERLRNIRDLNDTARDLGLLQGAELTPAPLWNDASTSSGITPTSRRTNDTEADLRRLIRETTSRRATEAPSKLAR